MANDSPRTLRDRVERVLDRLRPALLQDGGNVELLDVSEDGTVHVELQGNCAGCPAQSLTIRHGLEPPLRAEVPEVVALVAVAGSPEPAPLPRPPRGLG